MVTAFTFVGMLSSMLAVFAGAATPPARRPVKIRDCETCKHFKLGWNRERRICGGFPDVPCDGAESDFNLLEIPVLTAANFDDVMASSKLVVALFTQGQCDGELRQLFVDVIDTFAARNERSVLAVHMECMENKDKCEALGIREFPVIYAFGKDRGEPIKHENDLSFINKRDLESTNKFVLALLQQRRGTSRTKGLCETFVQHFFFDENQENVEGVISSAKAVREMETTSASEKQALDVLLAEIAVIQTQGLPYIGNTVNIIRQRITELNDQDLLEGVLIRLDLLEFMSNSLFDH